MSEGTAIREVRRRYDVPGTIQLRIEPREVLAWRTGHEEAVRAVASHPDDLPASGVGGRGPLRQVEVIGRRLLVREFRKGGLLRRVRGSAMHGPWRPLAELVLHRRLDAAGVPVADAVGCVILRRSFGWRGFLLLEEVIGARDLEAVLHGRPLPGRTARHTVLAQAGRAVRRLHDAGVPHPDLHPKNLLVAPRGAVLLLDLDKARPRPGPLCDAERLGNLVRLGRAIEKHRLKGLRLSPRDALRFLEGYAGSREAAVHWLSCVRARLGRTLPLRRLWWQLIGEARPWRDPAEEA